MMKAKEITTASNVRQLAIDWQNWQSERVMSYQEIATWQDFFKELAQKHQLTEEFAENGII